MVMKFKGQLQWTDYLNSQLLHMQSGGLMRIVLYGAITIMGLGVVGALYLLATGQLDAQMIGIFLPLFLMALFFPLYRYVILPGRIKKIFFQQKELSSPFEMEFTDTSMAVSNEFGSSNRPWGHFTKWKENKEVLMLYHSDVLYTIIPKRVFADAQQVETVKAFLEKNNVPVAKSRFAASCILYIVLFIAIAVVIYINFRYGS
jgi:hypothetical protein